MIIECPACHTRYDIKAELPQEGRSVRCSKCNTVWRAMPEIAEPPGAAPQPEFAANGGTSSGTAGAEDGAGGRGRGAGGEARNGAGDESWSGGAFTEDRDRGEDSPASSGDAGPGGGTAASERPQAGPDIQAATDAERGVSTWEEQPPERRDSGKIRWFGAFLRRSGSKANSRAEAAVGTSETRPDAETIPFPRANPAFEPPPIAEDPLGLDEARAAVRDVFSGLAGQRPHPGSIFQAPVTAAAEEERARLPEPGEDRADAGLQAADTGWDRRADGEGQDLRAPLSQWNETGADRGFEHAPEQGAHDGEGWAPDAGEGVNQPGQHAPQSWMEGWRARSEDAGDPDAQLPDPLQEHFPGRGADAEAEPEPHAQFHPAESAGDANEPTAAGLASLWGRQPAYAGESGGPLAAEEEAGESSGGIGFDQKLYREIEETQEHAGEQARRVGRGSLALAAGWGLFLSVAGGLIAGLLGFRDIAAEALPGLAPVYRALGMPVTLQPLIFEGIQYEWAVSENRPVLVIKGAVYNRAHRNVKVPDFFVTIKDGDPALDREYSASLQAGGPSIRPDQRAEFTIELLSPSPAITAVELELRNVR